MRYTIRNPFEYESADATPPGPVDTPVPAAPVTAPPPAPTAVAPAPAAPGQAGVEPPPDDAANEPPLWSSADGHVLHLPPHAVDAVPPLGYRRPGRWARRRYWSRLRPAVRMRRQATINAVGRLVRAARQLDPRRSRALGASWPVFRSKLGGRPFRIVARPGRGLRHEILSIEPEVGEMEGEVRGGTARSRAVQGRILWPALGFPAVVSPAERPSQSIADGDAATCVCVLVITDKPQLTSEEAARHLRCVPWAQRGRRHIAAPSFAAKDLGVRNDSRGWLTLQGRSDSFGQHIQFAGATGKKHGIVGLLAAPVLKFYRDAGLAHLHEIRLTEAATARLAQGQYQLFWNNKSGGDNAPSDEMKLLVDRFAGPRRRALGPGWQRHFNVLLEEYMFEYRSVHTRPGKPRTPKVRAEILHPLFIRPRSTAPLAIGHLTDVHVDVRADVYQRNLETARQLAKRDRNHVLNKGGDYNNFNDSFIKMYAEAKRASSVLLLTGDLIDYGRGHWGVDEAKRVQEDTLYQSDRNWFLFYDLVAGSGAYTVPAYTILGNHDWRLNPYPPFAPGAPKPNELLNDHLRLTRAQQDEVIRLAHGDGSKRGFSYTVKAESAFGLLRERFGSALKAFGQLLAQTKNLEQPGFPTETSFESIIWYLLAINPFLDYTFTLPNRQSVLMLDWAKDEDVLFPKVENGEARNYDPFNPSDAAGTPRPTNSPTPLQQRLITEFLSGPSRAKVIAVHAPPISPFWDWYAKDLIAGRKTYANPNTARGPKAGHPLFAIKPGSHVMVPYGMTADRGSLGNEKGREWFIKTVNDPKYAVRLVVSGHVHRNGIYVVRRSGPIQITIEKPSHRVLPIKEGWLVSAPSGPNPGPLWVTTTSGGPRGSFEKRPLTPLEQKAEGTTTDPGWALLPLASNGKVGQIGFLGGQAPAEKAPQPVARPQRELIGV